MLQWMSEKEKNELVHDIAGDFLKGENGKLAFDGNSVFPSLALKSATPSSSKVFIVTVDDTGELTATEM